MPETPRTSPADLAELRGLVVAYRHLGLDGVFRLATIEALIDEVERLRGALTEIRDMQPREVPRPAALDEHGPEKCAECRKYERHPVNRGLCDAAHRLIYGWQAARKSEEEGALAARLQLRAREALDVPTPATPPVEAGIREAAERALGRIKCALLCPTSGGTRRALEDVEALRAALTAAPPAQGPTCPRCNGTDHTRDDLPGWVPECPEAGGQP